MTEAGKSKPATSTLIEVQTYFLQMHSLPESPMLQLPKGYLFEKLSPIDLDRYRNLYREVGAPWLWYEREKLSDDSLRDLIEPGHVHILVLKNEQGDDVGFAEWSEEHVVEEHVVVELKYFGLKFGSIGKGLGKIFLRLVQEKIFGQDCQRLWVHTCSLDHPRALASYQKSGFVEYKRQSGMVRIPQSVIDRANAMHSEANSTLPTSGSVR